MSAQCEVCTAPTDLYLCRQCVAELRDNLKSLAEGPYIPAVGGKTRSGGKWTIERRSPGLLANLEDVVLRRTRIGGSPGHRKRGDEITAPYEPDTEKGRWTKQGHAAQLQDAIGMGLLSTLRDLCESRGSELPPCDSVSQIAFWLASHAPAIACDEGAGQTFNDIARYVREIERVIDRPVGRKWLGRCPTWLDTERRACKVDLFAPEDAVEVFCRVCRTTHNCNRLRLLLFNDLEYEKITWRQLLDANRAQSDGFQISDSTLRWWRANGKLRPRAYRRPDGREVINRHNEADEPLYKWADVRKLRSEQGRAKVG